MLTLQELRQNYPSTCNDPLPPVLAARQGLKWVLWCTSHSCDSQGPQKKCTPATSPWSPHVKSPKSTSRGQRVKNQRKTVIWGWEESLFTSKWSSIERLSGGQRRVSDRGSGSSEGWWGKASFRDTFGHIAPCPFLMKRVEDTWAIFSRGPWIPAQVTRNHR